jgi:hypothetical protein
MLSINKFARKSTIDGTMVLTEVNSIPFIACGDRRLSGTKGSNEVLYPINLKNLRMPSIDKFVPKSY